MPVTPATVEGFLYISSVCGVILKEPHFPTLTLWNLVGLYGGRYLLELICCYLYCLFCTQISFHCVRPWLIVTMIPVVNKLEVGNIMTRRCESIVS